MQRDGIYILALLYELLIANNIYSNSVTPICLNKATVLKIIALYPTTSLFLRSYPLFYSHSTNQLYMAKAISTLFTARLANKQATHCLLACLGSNQARGLILGN